MRSTSVRPLLCGLILLSSLAVHAQTVQPVTLLQTEMRPIRSILLNGETYRLLVHFPDDYDPAKRYDVLYVLDKLDGLPMGIRCPGILHGE